MTTTELARNEYDEAIQAANVIWAAQLENSGETYESRAFANATRNRAIEAAYAIYTKAVAA